jgi:uncharacterized protein (DUF1330 family)
MVAYIVAHVDVHDPERYKEYSSRVAPTVVAHGGWFVGRAPSGDDIEVLEGDIKPARSVLIGFPDRAAARRWFDSPEYQAAAAIRRGVSDGSIWIVDEVPATPGVPTRDWGGMR